MAGLDQYRLRQPLPSFKTLKKKAPPASTFCACRPNFNNPNFYEIDTSVGRNDHLAIAVVSDVVKIMSAGKTETIVAGTSYNSYLRTFNLDAGGNIQSVPKELQGAVQPFVPAYHNQNPVPGIMRYPTGFYTGQLQQEPNHFGTMMTDRESCRPPEYFSSFRFTRSLPSTYNPYSRLPPASPYHQVRRPMHEVRGGWYTNHFVNQGQRVDRCPCPQCLPPQPRSPSFPSQQMWPTARFWATTSNSLNQPQPPQSPQLCDCGCGAVCPYPTPAALNSQVWRTSKSGNQLWRNGFGGSTLSQQETRMEIISPPINFGHTNTISDKSDLVEINSTSNGERDSSSSDDFSNLVDTFPIQTDGPGEDFKQDN